jgi:hypothetical protein
MSLEARSYLKHAELRNCFHRFAAFGLGVEPGLENTVKTMDNAHFAKMVRGWAKGTDQSGSSVAGWRRLRRCLWAGRERVCSWTLVVILSRFVDRYGRRG